MICTFVPWMITSVLNNLATSVTVTGIGTLACTFIYMYTWVYTGEVNAKRLRENYFQAILRQDIAYFDGVGAGEVTTRIQTDTREFIPSCVNVSST